MHVNLGPSKKTMMFINKMAPNLKEKDNYSKFMNRVRGQSKDSTYSSAYQ